VRLSDRPLSHQASSRYRRTPVRGNSGWALAAKTELSSRAILPENGYRPSGPLMCDEAWAANDRCQPTDLGLNSQHGMPICRYFVKRERRDSNPRPPA
jgi:hypothetical protein